MNKQVKQMIVAVGIALVGATAAANSLNTSKATSESMAGTIVPAERAMAAQPGAPDVKLVPTMTQSRNHATADGTGKAANAAANQAATLGPRGPTW